MRPLAWYWASVVFGREWMMKTAQNYGSPFLDVTYANGTKAEDLSRLDTEIAAGLANRFIRHVEGTTLVTTAPTSLGTENPQRYLMECADQACAYLLLGQESTTKSTPGQLGGQDTKSEVKRERVQGLARWVASEVLSHFVKAVLLANYGPNGLTEKPTIEPDFTAEIDPQKQAQRDQIFLGARVPLKAEAFYKANNLEMPEPGDLVLMGGDLIRMAEPIDEQQMRDEQAAQQEAQLEAMQGDGGQAGDEEPAQATNRLPVDRILARATPAELEALLPVVEAAERAKHFNGEHGLLVQHLKKIQTRRQNV